MKISTIIGSVVLLIATTGCAGAFGEKKPDPNLVAQLGAWERVMNLQIAAQSENKERAEENRVRFAEAQARMAEALANGCNGNATCILGVGASLTNMQLAATIEEVAAKGSGNQQQPQMNMPAYQPRQSGWVTAGDFILRGLGIAVPEWRMDRAGKYGMQTSIAQFDFLGGVIRDTTNAAAQMQPSIDVSGIYNTGTYTQVEGGMIGGDANGPGAGIGNTYAQDNSTRTSGNYNNVGDANRQDNSQGQINGNRNRLASPDNIDNSDNRNCAAGSGAPGGTGSATTGTGLGGAGAPGGNTSCGG